MTTHPITPDEHGCCEATVRCPLERFRLGKRVHVLLALNQEDGDGWNVRAQGTVVRLRYADLGAWVRLDHRAEGLPVHPFPADDEGGRGADVLTYPEWCTKRRVALAAPAPRSGPDPAGPPRVGPRAGPRSPRRSV